LTEIDYVRYRTLICFWLFAASLFIAVIKPTQNSSPNEARGDEFRAYA